MVKNKGFKSGYAAIVGRPNVGKSTLLNELLGEKVSITSPKPQTTRWQIMGVQSLPDAQIIYLDTPGIHEEEKRAISRYLNRVATSVMFDADVIVLMVDATQWKSEDELVVKALKQTDKPIILAINKMDLLAEKAAVLPLIEKLKNKLPFAGIVPISAKKALNTHALQHDIIQLLPEGPLLFPVDQLTDKSIRFQAAEIIREKLICSTEDELPYTTAVAIEAFTQDEKITEISAVIWVERPGQKAIIIGKKGDHLKKVGMAARRDLEKLVKGKVFLRLWVKVKEHWTDDEKSLRGLGYE
ncbi:MAG: GTPase Era [Gammaproteobacteria bacterium RIFCSPHIGHO2_12_FULL_45_12]|nr:MAG: GTPase Era [Gammaproteobacteria bacterium RIFCSPHIGHO2_12_FULL_45_12]